MNEKKRILGLALGVFCLFAIVIGRLWVIQVAQQEQWQARADKQHHRVVKEPFRRGVFLSNAELSPHLQEPEQPFVVDVMKHHLFIDPMMIPEEHKAAMAKGLAPFVKPPDARGFVKQFFKPSRSRKVAMWLGAEQKAKIEKWWNGFAKERKIVRNALFFTDDYQRAYPFGPMLGQVLHTVREGKEEKTLQGVPTGGLELQFNDHLKGRAGKKILIHSPRHLLEMGEVIEAPEEGAEITLTINHHLQAIVEEELAKGVEKCKAKTGWAVLMDPHTGEIWALAQYPFFDLRRYREYYNDPVKAEYTKVKAIVDANEVGSTMKPVTIAIAMKAGVCIPEEKVSTAKGDFPGRKKSLTDVHFSRFCNMDMAIQKSSNIYVARMVQRIINTKGAQWYHDQLALFGFGTKTGIELPGESEGVLPGFGKKHKNGKLQWSTPTPYSLAMGHNIQATTLQVMRVYAAFANGGYLVKPTLIKRITKTDAHGEKKIVYEMKPQRSAEPIIDAAILRRVIDAMKFTTKPGGSCSLADIYGFTECGKTASTEKIVNGVYAKDKNVSSFIGFAPLTHPRFVLIISMDEPAAIYIPGWGKNSRGGRCAAPLFRFIGTRVLSFLGESPDDPYGWPSGDPRRDKEKGDWLLQTEKLRQLYDSWNK